MSGDYREDAVLGSPKDTPNAPNTYNRLDALNTYIDGKMKRYSLLFTVNGGAFAIANLLGEPQGGKVVGGLALQALAIGATIFTVLMWRDIYSFGTMMSEKFFEDDRDLVFKAEGRIILTLLSALPIAGWLLAAFWPPKSRLLGCACS